MNDFVKLNPAQKLEKEVNIQLQATESDSKFSPTKAERVLDATRNANARRTLDRHRFEDE